MLSSPDDRDWSGRREYLASPERFGRHPIHSLVFDGRIHIVLDDIVSALGPETFSEELRTIVQFSPKVFARFPGGVREVAILDQARLNLVLLTSSSNDVWHLKVWAASLLTRAQQAGETFQAAVPPGSSLSPFAAIRAMCDQMEAMQAEVHSVRADAGRAIARADEAMMVARKDDGFYAISDYLRDFHPGTRLSADRTKEIGGWLFNALKRSGRLDQADRRKVFNPQDLDDNNRPLPGKFGSNRYSRKVLDEYLWPELVRRGWAKQS
jgi:hypothetical protein